MADARQALESLLQGNQHWVAGRLHHPHQTAARRRQVAPKQAPFAVIVSCIDSRVPPEVAFDRGVGDLFVVRTGAETTDDLVLGSIEFGPVVYHTPLIVVLGHTDCGAVQEAIVSIETGQHAPGHIGAVVEALRPAYDAVSGDGGNLVEAMVTEQVRLTVAQLRHDPVLRQPIADGSLDVVGGLYHLPSGAVDVIG